ncbi:MAG: hypothetical protein FWD71_08670, partial [Oscillospiraceae bacterium]|nr:hypothetical protein [Oscillospiraceae bacterium]
MTKTIRSRLAGYFLAVIILMFAVNINTGAENDTNNKNGTSEATEEVIVHNEVKVSVNGYGVKFTERPVFQNGVLFLELEAIVKVLGYTCEDN